MQVSYTEVHAIQEQVNPFDGHTVIDEGLLARCLNDNDWFYEQQYKEVVERGAGVNWRTGRPGVNWGEQATNLLIMRLRGMTYEKCGRHFGVTRERIRQVQFKAIIRLRFLARQNHFRLESE